ncbi:MAG TPA: tetratricopeptide repeat protein, partial [Terriglobia bacterium]|nr:tetratricopeptide repeat protein [Terriglobia bacterium]
MEPSSAEETLRQVELLLDRNRPRDARLLLKTALATDPENVDLLLKSAWTDYLLDEEDSAIATVKRVSTLEPEEPSARLLYFELLLGKNQPVEAERVILELLRDYPEHSHYYGRYAHLMLKTLNLGKARQLADEGLRYDSESDECLAVKTVCDLIERPAGATSQSLQQLLARHPESLRTLLLVIVALEERGDIKAAERLSRELVQANPSNEALVEMAHAFRIK